MNQPSFFKSEIKVVNVGIKLFYDSFRQQGVSACHVQWKPSLPPDLLTVLRKIL